MNLIEWPGQPREFSWLFSFHCLLPPSASTMISPRPQAHCHLKGQFSDSSFQTQHPDYILHSFSSIFFYHPYLLPVPLFLCMWMNKRKQDSTRISYMSSVFYNCIVSACVLSGTQLPTTLRSLSLYQKIMRFMSLLTNVHFLCFNMHSDLNLWWLHVCYLHTLPFLTFSKDDLSLGEASFLYKNISAWPGPVISR